MVRFMQIINCSLLADIYFAICFMQRQMAKDMALHRLDISILKGLKKILHRIDKCLPAVVERLNVF